MYEKSTTSGCVSAHAGADLGTESYLCSSSTYTKRRVPSEISHNHSHHWHAAVDEKTGHAVRDDLEHWKTVAAEYNAVVMGYHQENTGKLAALGCSTSTLHLQ